MATVPRRMGLSEDDVADVFQSTFLSLFEALASLKDASSLAAWLATTARRHALRTLERRKRLVQPDADWEARSDDADAEADVVASLRGAHVWASLHAMGPPCDGLLRALFSDPQPTYDEVSVRLGLPVGAIGPTRARCLDKLKRKLALEGFFDSDVSERGEKRS